MAGISRNFQIESKVENRSMPGLVQVAMYPTNANGEAVHSSGQMSLYLSSDEAAGLAVGGLVEMTLAAVA